MGNSLHWNLELGMHKFYMSLHSWGLRWAWHFPIHWRGTCVLVDLLWIICSVHIQSQTWVTRLWKPWIQFFVWKAPGDYFGRWFLVLLSNNILRHYHHFLNNVYRKRNWLLVIWHLQLLQKMSKWSLSRLSFNDLRPRNASTIRVQLWVASLSKKLDVTVSICHCISRRIPCEKRLSNLGRWCDICIALLS